MGLVNQPLLTHVSNTTDIRASDVESTPLIVKRKIEIINRANNSVVNTFILTLTNTDTKSNIFETVKNKTFTGTFTIESQGELLLKAQATNGVSADDLIYSNENTDFASNPKYQTMEAVPCTLYNVTKCVNTRILAMNWIDYGACMLTAPACYAQLWGSCTWDICFTTTIPAPPSN